MKTERDFRELEVLLARSRGYVAAHLKDAGFTVFSAQLLKDIDAKLGRSVPAEPRRSFRDDNSAMTEAGRGRLLRG